MGFFPKKKRIWLQNQKIRGKFLQPWNSNRPSTNISNLASNQETEAHTEEKQSRRICRYDRGLKFEASLETRVHAKCPWGSALSLRTVQKVLSLRTEQNANAVPCKVCARSCCRLRWGVHTQQHQYTNPEQSCGSDAGFEHITDNVFESDQGKSPGHGRHTLESLSGVAKGGVFSIPSHPEFSSHPLWICRQKKFPPKLTKICTRTWVRGTEIFL